MKHKKEQTRMKHEKEKTKMKKWKKILITLITMIVIGGGVLGFFLYGPYNGFRDWLITVSMTSMTHHWIAELFYSDETIQEVLRNNRVEEVKETTDTNLISFGNESENRVFKDEYEKQILAKNLDKDEYDIYADEEQYRIIKIKGNGYSGYLAVIYDPSKIKTLVTSQLGVTGEYLTKMAKDNHALVAVNGGRFYDRKGHGSGAAPRGVTFSNGVCKTTYSYSFSGGIVGFNKDNVLVLSSTVTKANALALNMRDCVTCGPFLIVNGKASVIYGNGGWGTAPRTALGQRRDGVVLMLVLDGRIIGRPGAQMNDLIEIMQNYGAYNAANLDGGTSTAMAVNGELISDPVDASGTHRTRPIATGFGLIDE